MWVSRRGKNWMAVRKWGGVGRGRHGREEEGKTDWQEEEGEGDN